MYYQLVRLRIIFLFCKLETFLLDYQCKVIIYHLYKKRGRKILFQFSYYLINLLGSLDLSKVQFIMLPPIWSNHMIVTYKRRIACLLTFKMSTHNLGYFDSTPNLQQVFSSDNNQLGNGINCKQLPVHSSIPTQLPFYPNLECEYSKTSPLFAVQEVQQTDETSLLSNKLVLTFVANRALSYRQFFILIRQPFFNGRLVKFTSSWVKQSLSKGVNLSMALELVKISVILLQDVHLLASLFLLTQKLKFVVGE